MSVEVGARVVRGPHWKWHAQDQGEGHLGTVTGIGGPGCTFTPDKTAVVAWDFGKASTYRIGFQKSHDLYIINSGPMGHYHPNVSCEGCTSAVIKGIRYHCRQCDIDLCCECYMNDEHALTHPFIRYNTAADQGTELPVREGARKIKAIGMGPGAKVVRHQHFEWGNQDDNGMGEVLSIRDWSRDSFLSGALVKWNSGNVGLYRLGHDGKVDIKYKQEVHPMLYYPEHLPVANKSEARAPDPPDCSLATGDFVRVTLDVDTWRELQIGHGGWSNKMAQFQDTCGRVTRVLQNGDAEVQFHSDKSRRYVIHPGALTKEEGEEFQIGDKIRVLNNEAAVKELQQGHGDWIDNMIEMLGAYGEVKEVYQDSDLRIALQDGTMYTVNPAVCMHYDACCTKAYHKLGSVDSLYKRAVPHGNDRLVRAAASGQLVEVKKLVQQDPMSVNNPKCERSAVQVAALHGHKNVLDYLLTQSANPAKLGGDGTNALHCAVIGKHSDIVDTLLSAGWDADLATRAGHTSLHLAIVAEDVACVQVLLRHHANVNIQSTVSRDSAFMLALRSENSRMCELLLATHAVDFSLRNKLGFNAMLMAACMNRVQIVNLLLTDYPQIKATCTNNGYNALHLAAINGHLDVAKALCSQNHVDVNSITDHRQTALMLAIIHTHAPIVDLLIRTREYINTQDEFGNTALHYAAKLQPMNIEAQESPELYTLKSQISQEDQGMVCAVFLLQHGADWTIKNAKQKEALADLEAAHRERINTYVRGTVPNSSAPGRGGAAPMPMKDLAPFTTDDCIVCGEVANVLFEPCGDVIACTECAVRMKKCLKCKQAVKNKSPIDGTSMPEPAATEPAPVAPAKCATSIDETAKLKAELDNIMTAKQCAICLDRDRNVVFKCGHGTCKECSTTLRQCHMCRQRITEVITIFE